MVSKYYQIIFNILRLFFSHDINGYHINATAPILTGWLALLKAFYFPAGKEKPAPKP